MIFYSFWARSKDSTKWLQSITQEMTLSLSILKSSQYFSKAALIFLPCSKVLFLKRFSSSYLRFQTSNLVLKSAFFCLISFIFKTPDKDSSSLYHFSKRLSIIAKSSFKSFKSCFYSSGCLLGYLSCLFSLEVEILALPLSEFLKLSQLASAF